MVGCVVFSGGYRNQYSDLYQYPSCCLWGKPDFSADHFWLYFGQNIGGLFFSAQVFSRQPSYCLSIFREPLWQQYAQYHQCYLHGDPAAGRRCASFCLSYPYRNYTAPVRSENLGFKNLSDIYPADSGCNPYLYFSRRYKSSSMDGCDPNGGIYRGRGAGSGRYLGAAAAGIDRSLSNSRGSG